MTIQVYKQGELNVKARIKAGDISTGSWSFSAGDGNKLLGGKDGDNWSEYSRWHLGEDTSAAKKTKARFKYPFGKNGKVYLSALRAIRTRSAQTGALSIFKAAGGILDMAKEQMEKKSTATDLEVRSIGEIRSITEEGIIEAYLTKWNTVDAYRSTFQEGAFKKTFQERTGKIKMLWDHDELIGKVIESREDQYGPWVRCQINLETTRGKDAYAHLRAGDVESFSFGFNTIKDKVVDRVRHISEVRVMEVSPVIFPANEAATVVSVRSIRAGDEEFETTVIDRPEERGLVTIEADSEEMENQIETLSEELQDKVDTEERAVDFDETLMDNKLRNEGEFLSSSLWSTLNDIWWENSMKESADMIVPQLDKALETFHSTYLEWATNYITRFFSGERKLPTTNEIAAALFEHSRGDLEGLAKDTSFKLIELMDLRMGKLLPIESRGKLAELSQEVQTAHHVARVKAVQGFCEELRRGGFSDAEKTRFQALLFTPPKTEPVDDNEEGNSTISEIRKLREQLV